MKRFQPKLLFVFTTFFTSMAMVLIGIFVYLHKSYPDLSYLQEFSWMPFAISVVPSIMRAIGILPVQHSLLSEVFPTEIRLILNYICVSYHCLEQVYKLKTFSFLRTWLWYTTLIMFYKQHCKKVISLSFSKFHSLNLTISCLY